MDYEVQLQQAKAARWRSCAVERGRKNSPELSQPPAARCGVWSGRTGSWVQASTSLFIDGQINLEVGVELASAFAGHGEVVSSATPGGAVATAVHFGPYNRLGQAHESIRRWCVEHGHELAGPNWEVYGHWEDAWNHDPGKIRTDIFYLLTTNAERIRDILVMAGDSK